jgi:hypothetical protein
MEVAKWLIENGVDPNCNNFTTPVLSRASQVGNIKMIEYLLSLGADVNLKGKHHGWSSLHWGGAHGQLKSVKYLISKGADFRATNKYGRTAKDVSEEHAEVVKYLSETEIKYVLVVNFSFEYYFFYFYFVSFPRLKKALKLFRIFAASKDLDFRKKVACRLILTVSSDFLKKKTIKKKTKTN